MATWSVVLTVSIMDGSATLRTETATLTGTIKQQAWVTDTVAAAAADQSIALGGCDDPDIVIVLGDTGIVYKLGAAGTDDIGADEASLVADDDDRLGISAVLVSNADAVDHDVTVIAFQST